MSDERKAPAFQFYADDFLAGIMGMSDAEVGVYIKLLALQWTRGGIGPRERAAVSSNVGTVDAVIELKFKQFGDGKLRNERLEKVRKVQESRSKVGSKGGSKTQANRVAKSPANKAANRAAKINPPSPSPSPSPSSISNSNSERENTPSRHLKSQQFLFVWEGWKNKLAVNNGVMMDSYTEQAQLYELEGFDTEEAIEIVRYCVSRTKCNNLITNGDHKRKAKAQTTLDSFVLKPESQL